MGKRLEALEARLQVWLERANRGHHLYIVCLLICFGGTLTAAYPVTAVVLTAVVMAPRRWLWIGLACATGSGISGGLIMLIAHLLGYNEVHALLPETTSGQIWTDASTWISQYGLWTIFAVGVSPLPQMPLLIFYGVVDDRILEAATALWLGKVIKYGIVAWIAQHFPEKLTFFKRIHAKRTPRPLAGNDTNA